MRVREILERHTLAVGGRAAIEGTAALLVEARIVEPAATVELQLVQQRPGMMRVEVALPGGGTIVEAFDGETAWQQKPSGEIKIAEGDAAAALRRSVELPGLLRGLHELPERGHALELDSGSIRVRLADRFELTYELDMTTFLIVSKRDSRPLHPDLDPQPQKIESRWSDYRDVEGVLRAHRMVDVNLETGDELQETLATGMAVVEPLPATFFAPRSA